MKLNKKGFAISTMLYGIVFVAIAVFYMIIAIVSNRNTTNTAFVDEVRDELKEQRTNEATLNCVNRTYNGESQVIAEAFKATITENESVTNAGTYQVTAQADDGYAFADGTTTKTETCSVTKTTVFSKCTISLKSTVQGTSSSSYQLSRIINFNCSGVSQPLTPFSVDIEFVGRTTTSQKTLGTGKVSSISTWSAFRGSRLSGSLPSNANYTRGAVLTIKVTPSDDINFNPETITKRITTTFRIT